jgi:hypothetical protein
MLATTLRVAVAVRRRVNKSVCRAIDIEYLFPNQMVISYQALKRRNKKSNVASWRELNRRETNYRRHRQ